MNEFVKEYQCSGCIGGGDDCYRNEGDGIGCGAHMAGTMTMGSGKIFLGLPKGFNRLGSTEDLRPRIFEKYSDCDWFVDIEGEYLGSIFNQPVWKYLNEDGHTLVRGMTPRINSNFLLIFLEDCMDKFDCQEITQEHMDFMD